MIEAKSVFSEELNMSTGFTGFLSLSKSQIQYFNIFTSSVCFKGCVLKQAGIHSQCGRCLLLMIRYNVSTYVACHL